jgi:hypothetical protein
MNTKICNKCSLSKSLDCFDYGRKVCKDCRRQYHILYYNKNKQLIIDNAKEYYISNKEKKKHYSRLYYKLNKERVAETNKLYRKSTYNYRRFKINETRRVYEKKRREDDYLFRLKDNIRRRINNSLNNSNKKRKSLDYLGCDIEYYKLYLENKFEKQMSWNNYGEWQIDHIIPLSSAKTEDELIKLFHYTNTQPLWKKDNLIKRARYDHTTEN